MKVEQARKMLKKFGWSSYPHEEPNKWIVYDPHSYNSVYTNRELIKLASSTDTLGRSEGEPGEMKRWDRRAARRNMKKIEIED